MKVEPKQVIVMRKDLNMRKGKMVAQGAHASMAVILNMMNKPTNGAYSFNPQGAVREWLSSRFTKVCVSVNSEQELLDIFNRAQDSGLPCALITDAGLTEFGGVPTNTCCAIGPDYPEQINAITGELKLL